MVAKTSSGEIIQLIRCRVGPDFFGLSKDWVHSIQPAQGLTLNSDSTSLCVGNLAGPEGNIPVYNLATFLGGSASFSSTTQQVIVLQAEHRTWGLLVDWVSQPVAVSKKSIVPLPRLIDGLPRELFHGVARVDRELYLFLAVERLNPEGPPPSASGWVFESSTSRPSLASILGNSRVQRNKSPNQILIFSISDPVRGERPWFFGVSISQVREIQDLPHLIRVPEAADFVVGLVNWRERPVPVIDLAARIGLGTSPQDQRTRLVIVRTGIEGDLLGILVRSSLRILRLPIPHLPSLREVPFDPSFTKGVVELSKETLAVLDLKKVYQQELVYFNAN